MEVEKSCVTFLLCGPCWYVHKPDVQNKWDGNTHTHTHTDYAEGRLIAFYFVHHAEVILLRAQDGVLFPCFCIQNLLQMITAQGFLHGGGARI